MEVIIQRIEGRKLILEVDLDQDFGPSSTSKSNFVATTAGFAKLDEFPGISIGQKVVRSNKGAWTPALAPPTAPLSTRSRCTKDEHRRCGTDCARASSHR
jgi:hypothetical protein